MGGNVVSSETLFSSPPIQNSNYNFMSSMPFQPFPPMIAVSFLTFTIYIYMYLLCISLIWVWCKFCYRKKKMGSLEERMRWKAGLGVNKLKKSQRLSKRVNNLPRRNAITGTPLARSKKWKRTYNIDLSVFLTETLWLQISLFIKY